MDQEHPEPRGHRRFGGGGIPGPATSYLDDPRTFGLRFTVKY